MPDEQPTVFATLDDLEKRWRALSSTEQPRASVLLEDASSLIRDTCPTWSSAREDTLRRVCCAVVRRAMSTDDEDVGATSLMDMTGPFTTQRAYSSPAGDLFLTKAEKRSLGCGTQSAFTITLAGDQ